METRKMDWTSCFRLLLVLVVLLDVAVASAVRPWSLRSKREVRPRGSLCDGKEDNVLYPLASDCTKYILCTGDYEYKASCPEGLFYDPNLQACNYDDGGLCQARQENNIDKIETVQPEVKTDAPSAVPEVLEFDSTFCANRPDGSYAKPGECGQYVVCANNVPHVRQCPPGLVYRTDTNSCDFDRDGSCQSQQVNTLSPGTQGGTQATTSAVPQGNLADRAAAVIPAAVEKAMNNLMIKMRDESERANNPSTTGSNPFKLVQKLQIGKPVVKQIGMNAFILENATQEIMLQLGIQADKAGMDAMKSFASPLNANPFTIESDEEPPRADPSTCPYPRYACQTQRYRSFDGSCNNLQRPIQGRSMTPLKRYLPADYGDGMQSLRKAKDGSSLPNPRLVSFSIHKDKNLPEPMHTFMLMQWGQFLDHDFSLTALNKLSRDPDGTKATVDVECGEDGCDNDLPICKPIPIPTGDPDFGSRKKCLMFVRSEGVPNVLCKIGPREQLNQLTSYIDASQIYGSTKEEADNLRDSDSTRGKLRASDNPDPSLKKLLPTSTEDERCLERQSTCYLAGDERVNEQTSLTSLHVIWLREHNRIEAELHRLNPSWSGEQLYQETRRIVGALQQQITYGEFLPVVLGPIVMKKYGLNLLLKGFYTGYNSSEDASTSNVFATAAFRFGHSLLTPSVKMYDSNYKDIRTLQLSELFLHPSIMTDKSNDGIDGIIRGACTHRIQTTDKFLTKQVTTKLFAENPRSGLGTDLASLNIQRSRDHGIPGYNQWRVWCGLRRANNFNELIDMDAQSRQTFSTLYRSVDDIDIFPAGLAESPVEGSLLGPTFSCILGREFARFRRGDRFWYENPGQFTDAQLQEIRKVKLSKILCQNGDNITNIQPAVFESPFREAYPDRDSFTSARDGLQVEWLQQLWTDNYNRREECSCLPAMDLSKFSR